MKKKQDFQNYIAAYADERVPLQSKDLIETLQKMDDEGVAIYENQRNITSTITQQLVEALAKVKLDRMSYKQMVQAIKFDKDSGISDIRKN